ncbi:MAG: type II secretion system protein [Planctomycetota bacterium]
MKSMLKGQNGSRGFTIIELLTVMSVIILLMGLFMPAMNMVRRYARRVAQHNQLHGIEVALAMFNAEWQEYPNATPNPPGDYIYPSGAYALAQSMVGNDLLGYAPDGDWGDLDYSDRRSYLEAGNANAYRADFLYGNPLLDPNYVLSDVYPQVTHPDTGRSVGMPILYYVANVRC